MEKTPRWLQQMSQALADIDESEFTEKELEYIKRKEEKAIKSMASK